VNRRCKVTEAIVKTIPSGSRCLVAVSGGIDSSVLLHVLNELRSVFKLTLVVGHVNHNLRPNSIRDEVFVQERCHKYGNIFLSKTLQPGNVLQEEIHEYTSKDTSAENIELWARKERYAFFREILEQEKLDILLTAHHANDVVETFLMRLLANKQLYSIEASDIRRSCIRPFISLYRNEIYEYALKQKIPYVTDETNSDTERTRNNIRMNLLPFLRQHFQGDIDKILFSQSKNIEAILNVINIHLIPSIEETKKFELFSKEWLKELKLQLQKLDDELAWRFVERVFRDVIYFNLGKIHCKRLLEFIHGNAARIELPAKKVLIRREGKLILEETKKRN
jgi:tRNA(Ile)-lysidine synthetase-like protein